MTRRGEEGQALLLLIAALAAVLVGAWALGAVASGIGTRGRSQRAADLAALSGARAMHDAYDRLFEPVEIEGRPNPRHLERSGYLALGRAVAVRSARVNGASAAVVSFPDGRSMAPVRVRVVVEKALGFQVARERRRIKVLAVAEAELAPPGGTAALSPGAGDYRGPFAYRQGKPMRPDVAVAFDRLAAAAAHAGLHLLINSAWRSTAEQAALFAKHPDPRWVAPPGKSLHRLGTELDLGPPAAYGWLLRSSGRFHFIRRYPWEPWHFGLGLNPGSASVGFGRRASSGGDGSSSLPSFVPARFAAPIATAAQRWNISGALIAAQLYAESGFNPFAVSPAGAQGIAQFMPGTAGAYGLRNPFDAARSIDAQARLMRDLLRQFGAVPLALAAYNAGPAPVARCGCVPRIPETQGYVARILGLLGGAGQIGGANSGLEVRLVS
ncbi:MAG: lytic transglycosylase domain-containing protein [Solirubrobacteraceae bacterium]